MYDERREEGISVVIPTRGRPHLVLRAVRSALDQTLSPIEVVLIVDGPDDVTVDALRRVGDPRLKILELPDNVGPSDARNAGVAEARGTWIAFLDDDDEWLPRKLEVQIRAAKLSRYVSPIVTSRFIARTPNGEFVWPKRLLKPSEPVSEYLMVRKGLFLGETWIGGPTILARAELLRRVPFKSGLRVHEDWDWVLRASKTEGVGIEFVPDPLTICYIQEGRESASASQGWRSSLAWIQASRDLVTPRAYVSFVAAVVGSAAARRGEWRAFLPILREILGSGRPRLMDLLLFTGMWIVPQGVRRRIRAFLARRR